MVFSICARISLTRPSISEALPPPSTIVVLSLSMVILLVIALPPVRIATSPKMALRLSPKPGAFTAATFSVPRSLFTTKVASASPSTSSAIISNGLPPRATCSSRGRRSFIALIFFS